MTGIFFDIDDTLYSRRELLIRASRDTLSKTGRDPMRICGEGGSQAEDHFMETFYRFSDENFPRIISGEITPWESNVERYVNTLRYYGVDASREDGVKFSDWYTYLLENISMSNKLHSLMRELSKCSSLKTGIISNGTPDRQREKYYRLGLDKYIDPDAVIISGDLGTSKPDSRIFIAAGERFGLPPERLWMVGDSVPNDINGAKACGWHTLWLRRGNEDPEAVDTDLMAWDEEEMCRLLLELKDSLWA